MLKEFLNTRQASPGYVTRQFQDDYFNLYVWLNADGRIAGFRLCYDIKKDYRALTWDNDSGFYHDRVDEGEENISSLKQSPILVPDGIFDKNTIAARFCSAAAAIDKTIADFVYAKLLLYDEAIKKDFI